MNCSLNKVSIRAPCCKKWYDCVECHSEEQTHKLARSGEMCFGCKKCRKTFRKLISDFDEADEYCPHCDNHYIIEAKTPAMGIQVEGDDPRLMRDYREIQIRMLADDLMADRLG